MECGGQVNKEFEFVVENKTVEVEDVIAVSEHKSEEEPKFAVLKSMEVEEDNEWFGLLRQRMLFLRQRMPISKRGLWKF